MARCARLGAQVVLVGMMYAVAACAADDPVHVVGSDPVIIVHDFSSGMQMRIDATLAYDPQSKCLRLNFRTGPSMVPIWPNGTRPLVQDGKRGVQTPAAGRVVEGDAITAAGGTSDWTPPADAPPNCFGPGRESNVFVISADEPVAISSR